METIVLLVVMGLTAAAFAVMRRRLGDEPVGRARPTDLPPRETNEAAPAPTRAETPAAASIPAAAPSAFRSQVTIRPVEPSAAAVAPAQPAAAPTDKPTPPPFAWRPVSWVLLLGGGLLLALSFMAMRALPPEARSGAYVLMLIGTLTALLGVRAQLRGEMSGPLARLLGRVAGFLSITPAQAALLALALPLGWLARLAAGNGMLAVQPLVAVLAWLAAIGFVISGSLLPIGAARPPRPRLDRWDGLAMAVLFVVALVLRGYATATYPNTFSGDEGSAALFARQMLDGQATNLFTVGWFSFPALYFAVQSLGIAIGGQTVEAVRLTSAVAGALTVPVLYLLARAMFDRTTAILAAAYLTASHYHIHMSRIALQNVWDGLFGTLAMLGLWAGWKSNRRAGFILAGLAMGLGLYFYVSTRVVPVLFLVWAAAAWWRARPTFRTRLPGLVVAAYVALIVALPLGLYFMANPNEFQAPLNRVTIFDGWLENEAIVTGKSQAEIMLDQTVAGVMGFTSRPLRLLYDPGAALLLTAAGLLFIAGVLWALLSLDLRYFLLLLPLAATVVANATSLEPPSSQRYVLAIPIVAIFVALPLGLGAEWLSRSQAVASSAVRRAVPLLAAAAMLLLMLNDVNYYFRRVYPGYVLGGLNTAVATDIAGELRGREPGEVYFFGFPRMGYYSLSTIPYLAPQMNGIDIEEPLTAVPSWPLTGPATFIFLPERFSDIPYIEAAYPGGRYREVTQEAWGTLYAIYEVDGG